MDKRHTIDPESGNFVDNLERRSKQIELLEKFATFLETEGYTDTDWRTEEPSAIDKFLTIENGL